MNKTIIHSTVCIQQQHIDIHRNLIISSRIWQKYANKQWNDQIKKQQWHNNSIKQENVTNSWTIKKNLQFVHKKMRIYYNLQHENIFTFKMKQKIYLSHKNFKIKQSYKKLDYQKMKTFKIKWQIELITFKLELSKHSKTHLIVHTVLLESASDNTKLTKIINIEKYKNQNYIVEKILKKNQIDRINHYLVK